MTTVGNKAKSGTNKIETDFGGQKYCEEDPRKGREGHGGEASAQYDGESAGRLGSMGESESD